MREFFAHLSTAGWNEANVARWFGVPRLTDARWTPPPPPAERPRRGLGGWIALFVAGEAVEAAALRPQPDAAVRAALGACGLCDDDGVTLTPRARLLPWRGLSVASPPGESFDVSALNVAASLPSARTLWDVGCGAGLLTLAAARAGAAVLASDVDAGLVGWARLNAALNGVAGAVRGDVGDLLAVEAARGARFDAIVFNAPLLRAPLATGDEAPRYLAASGGEALALRFLDAVGAHLEPGGRVLLHAQRTAAVARALAGWAARARVTSVIFAHAPDGTPHALTEIDVAGPPGERTARVPLSAACAHLERPIFDALARPAEAALADDATPLPAPWLELCTRERFDAFAGGRRRLEVRLGGVALSDEDLALLERLRGEPVRTLGLGADERARLAELAARGLVIAG